MAADDTVPQEWRGLDDHRWLIVDAKHETIRPEGKTRVGHVDADSDGVWLSEEGQRWNIANRELHKGKIRKLLPP
ncbi:MAG: hypothetical protein DMF96_21195 [Acidobacteria bacterium]|nr:MAG: hypothetical protein DMF96_21195 [Acidobacteriota bacterium]